MNLKTLGLSLCCFTLIVSVCFGSNTLGQDQRASSQVKQLSTLTEIVDQLNKTSFPQARIGLNFEGSESYANSSDAWESMGLNVSRLSEQAYFSPGFTVASLDGCLLTLKNDQVKILNWGTSSYNVHLMSLAKFVVDGKKGEKKLTPQTGVLTIPLDKLSHKGGKAPHKYTKDPAIEKLLGTWRTEYKWKGFFKRRLFEMEITAAEGPDLKSTMTSQKLRFMFDDKQESETFDKAFRQAIQLCSTK